ncbi:MAG TPA: hypothetical protein VNL74_12355 [Methylococcus sp.]|nr:hypothetical protein [Methylococcus sp.]
MQTLLQCTTFLFALLISTQAVAQAPFPSIARDPEWMKARIADLNPPDKGLPENEYSLIEERRALESEISYLRAFAQQPIDRTKDLDVIDKVKEAISGSLADISKVDCSKLPDGRFTLNEAIKNQMMSLQRLQSTYPWIYEKDPFTFAPWSDEGRVSDAELCARWKKFVGDPAKQAALLTYFEHLKSRLSDEAKKQAETRTLAATLIDLLQKRKDVVDQRLAAQSTKTELSDKLWIVIGVIGGFSIGAILAVKLFTEAIQIEWVASGQVIQFVTVMILLSVIMALGLAGILRENTLGTLLGGIAGYVLAQGVGRAAAREVSRGREKGNDS